MYHRDSKARVTCNILLRTNDRVLLSMKRSLGAHGMAEDKSVSFYLSFQGEGGQIKQPLKL